jgi:hypothetical protein
VISELAADAVNHPVWGKAAAKTLAGLQGGVRKGASRVPTQPLATNYESTPAGVGRLAMGRLLSWEQT